MTGITMITASVSIIDNRQRFWRWDHNGDDEDNGDDNGDDDTNDDNDDDDEEEEEEEEEDVDNGDVDQKQ